MKLVFAFSSKEIKGIFWFRVKNFLFILEFEEDKIKGDGIIFDFFGKSFGTNFVWFEINFFLFGFELFVCELFLWFSEEETEAQS